MKQVFFSDTCKIHQKIMLDEGQAHHLFDVLRIKQNETIRVVAENQKVFLANPTERPYLYIYEEISVLNENKQITLCASLIKQDKFEWMLQKACELGVTRIVPYTSKYSVVQIDEKKEQKKLERWSKILFDACKQCNRNDLVELTSIQKISDLQAFQSDLNLVAYEKETLDHHLAHYLKKDVNSITFCLGPEGGFAPDEIEHLKDEHFQTCSLGNNILRAETAACYVLSCIEYQKYVSKENVDEI